MSFIIVSGGICCALLWSSPFLQACSETSSSAIEADSLLSQFFLQSGYYLSATPAAPLYLDCFFRAFQFFKVLWSGSYLSAIPAAPLYLRPHYFLPNFLPNFFQHGRQGRACGRRRPPRRHRREFLLYQFSKHDNTAIYIDLIFTSHWLLAVYIITARVGI